MPSAVAKKNPAFVFTNAIKVIRDMPDKRIMPVKSILSLGKSDLSGDAQEFPLIATGIFMINPEKKSVLPNQIQLQCDSTYTGLVDVSFKVPAKHAGKHQVLFFRHEPSGGKKAALSNSGLLETDVPEEVSNLLDLSMPKEKLTACRMPGEGEKFAYDIELDKIMVVKEASEGQLELRPFAPIDNPFTQNSISYLFLFMNNGKWGAKIHPHSIELAAYFPLVDTKL